MGKLLDLLAVRHSGDVFVSECKNGPSQGTSHIRLDAWAMKKSWSNPLTWGYEIKVSRNDFLRDDKWHTYLPYCAEFYFVAPPDVIQPNELPPEAGLLSCSRNHAKLFMKKKAQRRSVVIPEDLFRYVLMCRSRVGPERDEQESSRVEFWREWLAQKADKRDLGFRVSYQLSRRVRDAEQERDKALREAGKYQEIKDCLKRLGFDQRYHIPYESEIRARVNELKSRFSPELMKSVDRLVRSLTELQEQVKSEIEEANALVK